MDIKDSYLHGAIGVVKSINVNADKLQYKLADVLGTVREVTMPLATTSANGLMSSADKSKLDNLSTTLGNYVTINTDQTITGTKTFTKQLKFTTTLGNAPFLISSTTKVDNLNSDYLDGKHDYDFIIRSAASDLAYGDVLFHSLYNLGYSYKIETTNVKASLITNTTTYSTSGWTEITNETDKLDYLKVFNRDRNSGVSLDSNKCGIRYTIHVTGYNQGEFLHLLRGFDSKGLNWIVICEYLKVDSSGNVTSTHLAYNQKITWNDSEQTYIKCTLFGDYNRIRITFISADDIPTGHAVALYNISLYTSRGGSQGINLNHGFRYANLNSIIPYSNNKWYLGTSGFKWKGVYAYNFYGNLNGQYINALTGYAKATSMSSIAASDSLNSALGKLEYKTDFIYNDIIGGENNADVIDKWSEIKDFIAEVGNSTDITDEFVTRKTALTITGEKTFDKFLRFVPNATGGHAYGLSNIDSAGDNNTKRTAGIGFINKDGIFSGAYIGWGESPWSSSNNLYVNSEKFTYKNYNILHAGNSHITNGVITINGVSITPLTEHQSLSNYVTLDTTQTISGAKTFTSTLTTRSITPLSNNTYSLGTSDKKWLNLYATNIYSNAIYNGTTIYASNNEIIHADSSYFELNKGYPNSIMWMNASEYKLNLGSKGVQFMIAANGNVGIGNVGGAPAYKLHVGGGEVMADTYHAWSGGFKKNGSSDSYVLLGGGGHKLMSTFFTSLTSDSTNVISITICGTTKSINKSTLASSLGLGSNAYTSTAYLPLTGGIISNTSYGPLTIERKDSANMAAIKFKNSSGDLGSIGMNKVDGNLLIYNANTTAFRTILDSGNYINYTPILNSSSTHATNTSIIYAPTSAGNAGQILVSNGSGAPIWKNYSTREVSKKITTSDAGWYRIAESPAGISNCQGTFEILGALSSFHTSAKIVTGTSYGKTVSLSIIDCQNWTLPALTKIRLVYHTSWTGNYAYLEVYKVALANVTISVKSVNGFGWTLIDPVVGSVPSGYSTLERNLTSNVLQTDNILAISASFSGSVTLTGTTADTSVLKFSRSGSNTWNYILWPGNSNKDCKLAFGYSNNSAGVYYYMSSGALYPAANNTYDLGTTNNTWKTIYGTVTNVAGELGTVDANRHVWFSDSFTETRRNYDDDFMYNPYNNLLTVGSITGSAAQLTSTNIISDKKFTSLTTASWTDTGYTFTNLESGTYAILVTSTNLVASGIMSVYKNIADSVGDEIPLHVYGTAGWRPYLRTYANKLLISSNDVTAAANGRTVTIKIAKIL